MMTLQLFIFAGLAEKLGGRHITLELEQRTLSAGQLKQMLIEQHPDAAEALKAAYLAVNQAYADSDTIINEGDELALIPPVSGGQPEAAEIVTAPINADNVLSKVLHPNHGASIVFVGTTREYTYGARTLLLRYEAYEPMAVRTMKQIIEEIKERWEGAVCAITHRLGEVSIGESSVVIAVSAPHRDAAYKASRYAIDRLKQIVPIWKKEIWEDGSEWKGHQTGPWNPTASLEEAMKGDSSE